MSNTLSVKSNNGDSKEEKDRIGCKHYARKCALIAPCCNKAYTCRVCHDEKESHEVDRKLIQKIKCLLCELVQVVQKQCEKCEAVFGKYFCELCRLFDDEDKGQYHCDGCGLCRIGGRENFFHCEKCDMCLAQKLKGHHKCVEESSRRNCAICLEDLHTSRIDGHIPPCGHLIHRSCFEQCVKTGNYACPTCAESLFDMKTVWDQLDAEVANTQMPEDYRDFHVFVLCRDCHMESKVLFHVIGLKCSHCGSYNTCRAADPDEKSNDSSSSGNTGNAGTDSGVRTGTENNISGTTRMGSATLSTEDSATTRGSQVDGAVGNTISQGATGGHSSTSDIVQDASGAASNSQTSETDLLLPAEKSS